MSDYEEKIEELEEINKNAKLPLELTNKMISFGNTSYPVRNISSVTTIEKTVRDGDIKKNIKKNPFLYIIGGFFMLIGIGNVFSGTDLFWGIFWLIIGFPIFIDGTSNYKLVPKLNKVYGIQLQTNSGTLDLFFSEDKEFIENIYQLIYKILSDDSYNIQYTINIADKQIIDNSINIKNETNNYTTNLTIKVKQEGISKEDLEFIYGDFQKALENLDTRLQEVQDNTAREQLQEIVNEVNSEEPNPSKIKKIWKKLDDMCSKYDTLSTISDIGETILKGASIFFLST